MKMSNEWTESAREEIAQLDDCWRLDGQLSS